MSTGYPLASLAVLIALGLSASGTAASAQSLGLPEQFSERVSYRDLDLTTDVGAFVMLKRITRSASSLCNLDNDDLLDGRVNYFACVRATVDKSVAKLQSPRVTALYDAGQGKGNVILAESRR